MCRRAGDFDELPRRIASTSMLPNVNIPMRAGNRELSNRAIVAGSRRSPNPPQDRDATTVWAPRPAAPAHRPNRSGTTFARYDHRPDSA